MKRRTILVVDDDDSLRRIWAGRSILNLAPSHRRPTRILRLTDDIGQRPRLVGRHRPVYMKYRASAEVSGGPCRLLD